MDLHQAIAKIEEIGNGPHLARIFLDGRDCGAWYPASAAEQLRTADRTRAGIDFDVTVCQQLGSGAPAIPSIVTDTASNHAEDLRVMIKADQDHLVKAVDHGDRVLAHGFVDSIINNQRELEDLTGSPR